MMHFWAANAHFTLVVLAGSALALCIFRARNRREHALDMGQRNLLATNFGFFTTLYTFFLGFAVMTLWQNYSDTDTKLTQETDLLVVEYRLSHSLKGTDKLRALLQEYAAVVAEDEWPAMNLGKGSSKAAALYEDIWRETSSLRPQKMEDQFVYSIMLNNLVEVNKLRHFRLLQVNGSLYPPLWVILYLGVGFTIIGFYFASVENKISDGVYIVTTLVMIFANLYIVIALDKPFGEPLCLSPDRFLESLQAMRAITASM